LDSLDSNEIKWQLLPLMTPAGYERFYQSDWNRLFITFLGLLRRFIHLSKVSRADFVVIHREAFPIGPSLFEWVLHKVLCKKIIFDFDDALWLQDPLEMGSLKSWMKQKGKFAAIIQNSYKISAGNKFLASYARQFNPNVILLPTVVDTEKRYNTELYDKPINQIPVIGWTGSHSTLPYLNSLRPTLNELAKSHRFKLAVISNENPNWTESYIEFFPWKRETEVSDLMKFDIGIMPLLDDEWSRGKCGFKLIQYFAMKIPAIASAVGENLNIVNHGMTGFLCSSDKEWKESIIALLYDETLRHTMGMRGRLFVESNYSKKSAEPIFLSLFK
jgi:glycosyltransferase involved in cell wall biosynthesis